MKNDFLKNTSWIMVGKIYQMIMFLIVGMFVARYLGPKNYGIINYTLSFVAFFSTLCTLGLDVTIMDEFMIRPDSQGTTIGSAIAMRLIVGFISTGLLICIFYKMYPSDYTMLMIIILQAIAIIFQSFDILGSWYLSKLESKKTTIIQIISCTIMTLYQIIIIKMSKNIVWFAFTKSLDVMVMGILLMILYNIDKNQKLRISYNLCKQMLKKSYHFIISGLMVIIYAQADKIMIGSMLDESSVGLYSVAIAICGLWSVIPASIINSSRVIIMKEKRINEAMYIKRLKQLYATIIWLSIAYGIFVTIFSRLIIILLYGKAYLRAQSALLIVVWYCSFSYLGSAKNIWMICENKQKYEKWFTLAGVCLNIFLNFILIPKLGINGAAIATLITQAFTNFILTIIVKDTRINGKYMLEAFILDDVLDKNKIKRYFKFN